MSPERQAAKARYRQSPKGKLAKQRENANRKKRGLRKGPRYSPVHYARQRAKINAIMTEFRKDGCQACPEKDEACLAAHHLDPTIKEANISNLCNGTGSQARLKAELRKCVCLCQNCHYKFHAGREITIRVQLSPSE